MGRRGDWRLWFTEVRIPAMADRPLAIDIKQARLLKSADLFLITDQDGSVRSNAPGFGLFYRDCRYLSAYELSLNGTRPLLLMAASEEGFAADMELTNARMTTSSGAPIHTHMVGMRRQHILVGEECTFIDVITFRNFTLEELQLPLTLSFAAGFESIFVLRGAPPGRRGQMHAPEYRNRRIRFRYSGADDLVRSMNVGFSMHPIVAPHTAAKTFANFELKLAPQQSKTLRVAFRVSEIPQARADAADPTPLPTLQRLREYRTRTSGQWLAGFARTYSRDRVLNDVLQRSFSDVRLLRVYCQGEPFIAAGMPWFVGLFGRDSLIPSLQSLAFNRDVALHTARLLAHTQGRTVDARRHEQPGKILHELRVGEMAHLREIPQTPSYASIDSTLLFLILIARHAAWTGSLDLFHELRANVDRALEWIGARTNRYGYIEYDGKTDQGAPQNQGWKDSEDAIVREDGSFPEPPISLVEVQGYAYFAQWAIAELFDRSGEQTTAARLRGEAEALRARFNRDFWMADKGCYCLALEAGGRPVTVITSNAGQTLWTGIADPDKAQQTARRMMQEDMFSGWGVRTLSEQEVRYNPFAYQLGSIWPFDNSLILAGLRHYGLDDFACRIFSTTLAAATRFDLGRLPEFFAGTQREEGLSPAHCPRADPLQAWSAGSVPFMVSELLGLRPQGFEQTLRIVRPVLPEPIDHLELHGIQIGAARVDLRFARESAGHIVPQVLNVHGALKVEFEAPDRRPANLSRARRQIGA